MASSFPFVTTVSAPSRSFYAKVSDLHAELYKGPGTAMANPLVAFTLIKRLHSEWLNLVYSDEAMENAQGWLPASLTDTSGDDNLTPPPPPCSLPSPPNPLPLPRSPFGLLLSSPQVQLRAGRGRSAQTGRPPGGRQGADAPAGCVRSPSGEPREGPFPETQ